MAVTDLTAVLDGELESGESVGYECFYLIHQINDRYIVQLDGHAGVIDTLDASDYDDELELVSDLNQHLWESMERHYHDDRDAIVNWAGRMITADEERAANNPDHFVHVPEPEDLPTSDEAGPVGDDSVDPAERAERTETDGGATKFFREL